MSGAGSCAKCAHSDESYQDGWLRCCLATSRNGWPRNPDTPMMAIDPSEYMARLLVKPTHGCRAFEPCP